MTKIFFKILFLFFSISALSQSEEDIVSKIKNDDIKTTFESYLNQEKIVIKFFQSQANPNNEGSIDQTNEENIVYYDQAILEYNALEKYKIKIYNNYYDIKYAADKVHIYKRFDDTDQKLNTFYITRFKLLKTKISNALKPEKADVLPSDVCQRLSSTKELLEPTHDSCKSLGLNTVDETTCFANFLRRNVTKHIQKYIGEEEESLNISNMIQFVIDNEGNLIFDKFTKSCGLLKFDLVVYRGFKSFASSTVFCPAKYNNKNVAVFYNLPIRMVIEGY